MDWSAADMALFPRWLGQLFLVAQLPALHLAYPESLVDRHFRPDFHPPAQHTALDHASVHLLGGDPLAAYHPAPLVRLAPLHIDPAWELRCLVFRPAGIFLSYRIVDRFCHLSRARFFRGPAACRTQHCALAASYGCRTTRHPALRLRPGADHPAGGHCHHRVGAHRIFNVVGW